MITRLALVALLLLPSLGGAQPHGDSVRARITERITELRRIHTPDGIELLEPVAIGDDRHADPSHRVGVPGTVGGRLNGAHDDQRAFGKNAVTADRTSLDPTLLFDRLGSDAEDMVAWVRSRLGR